MEVWWEIRVNNQRQNTMLKYPKKKWPKKKAKKGTSKTYLIGLWSKYIKIRAGGRCELCGSTYSLESHHIFKRGWYVHCGWFNPDNGICLCRSCHSAIHDLYFPRVKEYQEKINEYLKKKGINYDSLYITCKSRKVDLELTAILLKK